MIELRPFARLGQADHGWLKTRHHFSFAGYRDPERAHWGNLLVWNDDEIQPGAGFPPHPHDSMEIVTYVREGAITHQDSMGNRGRTEAGDVQVMSAGIGIRHSEYNLESKTTRLFQIWIAPSRTGGQPAWGTKPFPKSNRAGHWVPLASGSAEDGDALPIRADARVLGASVKAGESLDYAIGMDRHGYLVPSSGTIEIGGVTVETGDGLAIHGQDLFRLTAKTDAELVLVDSI